MNKIFVALLLTARILFAAAEPDINSHKAEIFFANGINNTKEEAQKSATLLKQKILQQIPEMSKEFWDCDSPIIKDCPAKIQLAYNNTFGIIADALEAKTQKAEAGELVSDSSFLGDLILLFDYHGSDLKYAYEMAHSSIESMLNRSDENSSKIPASLKQEILAALMEIETSSDQEYISYIQDIIDILHNYDKTTQVEKYLHHLSLGKKILTVSHSQGNLFTNEVYFYLTNNYLPAIPMQAYSVATPASNVLGDTSETLENYMIAKKDLIAATSALPANIDIPTAITGHSFSDFYLADDHASSIIVANVKNKSISETRSIFSKISDSTENCDLQKFKNNLTGVISDALIFDENGSFNTATLDKNQTILVQNNIYTSEINSSDNEEYCFIAENGSKIFRDPTEMIITITNVSESFGVVDFQFSTNKLAQYYNLTLHGSENYNIVIDADSATYSEELGYQFSQQFTSFGDYSRATITAMISDRNITSAQWFGDLFVTDPTIRAEVIIEPIEDNARVTFLNIGNVETIKATLTQSNGEVYKSTPGVSMFLFWLPDGEQELKVEFSNERDSQTIIKTFFINLYKEADKFELFINGVSEGFVSKDIALRIENGEEVPGVVDLNDYEDGLASVVIKAQNSYGADIATRSLIFHEPQNHSAMVPIRALILF